MTLATFNFRKLETTDVENYKQLRLKAFQESPFSFSESYEDEYILPTNHFKSIMGFEDEHFTLGCFTESQKLVGISTFKRDKRSKAHHKSYISTMYVDPDFRGQKIAQTLLAATIDEAMTFSGLEQIHLWVLNPESSPARLLYLKAGWKSQGSIVRDDLKINGKYVDAEYMTLRLSQRAR